MSSHKLQQNNFDLIRLCLAAAVAVSHSYVLSGREELHGLARMFSSTVAVQAFFVISGFLIVMSYERSSGLASYLEKRLRRIYPAYLTIILVMGIGLCAVSTLDVAHYFASQGWWRYVGFNLAFMNFAQPTLPGVFGHNPHPEVNGALWTLKLEVMFYVLVPFIVFAVRRVGAAIPLALLYLGSVGFAALMTRLAVSTGSHAYAELARQLPGQLSFFVAGSALYYYFTTFERYLYRFGAVASLVLIASMVLPLGALEPLAIGVVVIFLGVFRHLGNVGRYGDFSYGLYIVHFPIIQLLVASGLAQGSAWGFLATVLALAFGAAVLMWHLVEKRFLQRSSHYRSVSHERPAPSVAG